MESSSATLGPCSSCRRIFQSRLFIANPVAGIVVNPIEVVH